MLNINGLKVSAGQFELGPLDLSVKEGVYFILLGPSGAGKTLMLETIAGLINPAGGSIKLDSLDITDMQPEVRNVAYVPQDLAIFPHLSVQDNITFAATERGMKKDETRAIMDELVELLELKALIDRRSIKGLSQGEKQRVALARALLQRPKLVLMDEPMSSLDPLLKRELTYKLKEVNRKLNLTLIHVTHDKEEAFMLGERIGVMLDGRLAQVGTRDELYYHPASVDAARFLLNRNIFSGKVQEVSQDGSEIVVGIGDFSLAALNRDGFKSGDEVSFGIRPEEVMMIRPDRPLGVQVKDNLFDGNVVDHFEKGSSHILLLEMDCLDETVEIEIPNCAFRDMAIKINDNVKVSMKKSVIWVLHRP